MKVKLLCGFLVILLCLGVGYALMKPTAKIPVVPKEDLISILELQRAYILDEVQIKQIEQSYPPLKQKSLEERAALTSVEDKAIKDAGLDPVKYHFDEDKLVFVENPPAAKAAPAPAASAPANKPN